MNRFYSPHYLVLALILLFTVPSWAQKSGGSGSTGGSSGGSGPSGSPPPSQPGSSPSGSVGQPAGQPQFPTPIFVNGRILMDTGQPVGESVSVSLVCGLQPLQVIHTDLKGSFQFTLGAGSQSNMDFSASSDAPSSGNMQLPSRLGGSASMLTGCEVQVMVPGFVPLNKIITDRADITGVEIGTLRLTRLAGVSGSSISVTSLMVPDGARKEFEKGDKDVRSKHTDSAEQHFEKAVAQYDKYAAAWNELGNLFVSTKETEKARQAFEKSMAADPHYIPPYLGLAGLELQNQEIEPAVETAGRALDLDPSIGVANFIQALGNFKLNKLDAAQKSAEMAEKGPHQSMPDLHALHANILLQKQDLPGAAAQMRAYLREFPQGRFADQMKKDLQHLELTAPDAATKPGSAPLIAP